MADDEGEDIPLSPREKTNGSGDYGASNESISSQNSASSQGSTSKGFDPDNTDPVEEEEKPAQSNGNVDRKTFLKDPFSEQHDAAFWTEVCDLEKSGEYSWSGALTCVRARYLKKRFALEKKDPIVGILTDIYDKFIGLTADIHMLGSFKYQVHAFCSVIMAEEDPDDPDKYKYNLQIPDVGEMSILHMFARRGLTECAKTFLDMPKYRGMEYVKSISPDDKLPVELALIEEHDDCASMLMGRMYSPRVRGLFEPDECFAARFKFYEIIANPNMKKTVIAVLDSCIHPDWPFTPTKPGDTPEESWTKMPDNEIRYHFNYRLLDGDPDAERPYISGEYPNGVRNPEFDHTAPSCLQLLARSQHKLTLYHPLVRLLIDKKWKKFAKYHIRAQFAIYALFMVFMSLSVFLLNVPQLYDWRYAFELLTVIMVVGYIIIEIDEMEKERLRYWVDPFNIFDLVGLFFFLIVVPLRFTGPQKAERAVMAVGYLINCLRVFKYFPAYKEIGIYSKTFANIIYKDMSLFGTVYGVCFIAFSGAIFLSVGAAKQESIITLYSIFLKEFRALAEGNPFEDDYDNFNGAITFLIMVNMFIVIVILSNILIGQLSFRYEVARAEAGIQYSVDKARYICRMQNARWWKYNKRIRYYVDGDYIGDSARIKVLKADWEEKKKELTDTKYDAAEEWLR